eukprot:gene7864-9681_t
MGNGQTKLSKDELEQISSQTMFNKNEVGKLFEEFKKADKDHNGSFDRSEFIAFFKARLPNYPAESLVQLFEAFDTDKSGTIDFKELTVALSIIGKGTSEEKLGVLFDVYDKDKSGLLDKNEIESMIQLMKQVGKTLGKAESDTDVFIRKLMEKIDVDKSNSISRQEWISQGKLTLTSIWLGLFVIDATIMVGGLVLVHHSLVNAILLLNMAMVLALCGVWVSLQFKWLPSSFPNLFSSMERVLLGNLIYPTSVIFTWTVIVFKGIESSPYYLCFFLCFGYYLYGLPLRSFRLRSSKQVSSVDVPNYWNQRIKGKSSGFENYSVIFKFGTFGKLICLFVLIGCLEYRVVFNSPTFYNTLHLAPPFNYIVVTVALYSMSIIFYFLFINDGTYAIGGVGTSSSSSSLIMNRDIIGKVPLVYQLLLESLSCLFGLSVSLVLGTPIFILPVAIVAIYLLDKPIFPFLLLLQSFILTFVEVLLYSTDPEMYPIYLIFFTTAVGLYINHRLQEHKQINSQFKMISDSIYISKVFALFLDPISSSMIPTFCFTLLLLSLYHPVEKKTTPLIATIKMTIGGILTIIYIEEIPIRLLNLFMNTSTLSSGTGMMQSGLSASSMLLYSQQLNKGGLNDTSMVYKQSSNFIMKLGTFLLTMGIYLVPISFKSFPQNTKLKNINLLLIFIATLLLFFNPQDNKTSNWTNLLIIFGVVIFTISFFFKLQLCKSFLLKVLFSVVMGVCVGLYISLNYFDIQNQQQQQQQQQQTSKWMIHSLFTLIFTSISLVFSNTQWPSPFSHLIMTPIYIFFYSLLPITSFFLGHIYGPIPSLSSSSFAGIYSQVELSFLRLSLVGLYIGLWMLLSIYLKYQTIKVLNSTSSSKHHSSTHIQYNSPMKKNPSSSSDSHHHQVKNRIPVHYEWIFKISNISCISTYLVSVYIHLFWFGGSEIGIFVLSPILLLLCTEGGPLKKLSESHRYFPMILSISVFLSLFSLYNLLFTDDQEARRSLFEWSKLFGISFGLWKFWWNLKNWVLFCSVLPSIYYINRYLWKFEKQKQFTWLILSPPALIAALFSDLNSISLLGLLGFLGSITQKFLSSQIQKKGNQVL